MIPENEHSKKVKRSFAQETIDRFVAAGARFRLEKMFPEIAAMHKSVENMGRSIWNGERWVSPDEIREVARTTHYSYKEVESLLEQICAAYDRVQIETEGD